MNESAGKKREIVYGNGNGGLMFLPKDLALELTQIYTALNTSKTWGEFKANVPAHVYEEVIEGMKDDEDPEALPQSEDAFNPHSIPAYEEGDWPIWTLQYMLEWIPEDIQQQFGSVETSATSGPCLELISEKTHEIVKALEKQGYICIEDVSLVESASGYE